ncbi:uncharacterized protein LOC118557496 [Fundulus heteroclitus]|uniref:uncharacterized protein LOC118557496 n=1 Tax=Fundulus heteroclitus TaxID=8078 RepID=UPI00165CAD90|nr:uncharacterized protein LOC118557496 [Fundulus heteroclitus]
MNDSAFYYCEEIIDLLKTPLNITFLRVEGPKPEIPTIVQEFPSLPVLPGDSVTLQCSVLPESLSSSDHHTVHWFKAGSDESHPNMLYVHVDSGDKCEWIPQEPSEHKCVYNLSLRSVSSSDAGTYYCAVATCGQILFGEGTKLEVQGVSSFSHSLGTFIFIVLLCAALVISVTVIVQINHTIKKLKINVTAAAADSEITARQQSQSINEDGLAYSVPRFTKRVKRGAGAAEGQSVYADVRILGYE